MAKFVKLKAFTHGLDKPARDFIANVEHIVNVSESTYNDHKGNSEKPCVYVTTSMVRELMVDCSLDEFVQIIESASGRYSHQTTAQVGEITYKCQS